MPLFFSWGEIVMKINFSYEIVDMGNEFIAVPVGENSGAVHGVVKLNKAGVEIIELLKSDTTVEKIVAVLGDKYDNDINTLNEDVEHFINILKSNGLIIE